MDAGRGGAGGSTAPDSGMTARAGSGGAAGMIGTGGSGGTSAMPATGGTAGTGGMAPRTGGTGGSAGSPPATGGTAGTTGADAGVRGGADAAPMSAPPPLAGAPPDCTNLPARDDHLSNFAADPPTPAGSLDVLPVLGRPAGRWKMSVDGSAGMATLEPAQVSPLRCDSGWAARFAGSAFTKWGALAQGLFDNYVSTDVSAYKGLRFNLRANIEVVVRLKVPDRNTFGVGGVCTVCDDHFGRDIAVGTSWREYVVRFSELKQEGRGVPTPTAFDPKTLYGVEFIVPKNLTFELWIDDVSFVR